MTHEAVDNVLARTLINQVSVSIHDTKSCDHAFNNLRLLLLVEYKCLLTEVSVTDCGWFVFVRLSGCGTQRRQ